MRKATRKTHSVGTHHRQNRVKAHRKAHPRTKPVPVKLPELRVLNWDVRRNEEAARRAERIVNTGATGLAHGLEVMALPFTWMLSLLLANLPAPEIRR